MVRALEDFPAGRQGARRSPPGVRIIAFERRVAVAYVILPSGDVEIGRFFYGGRDYEAIISGESDPE
jgi:plasmid stabilization system protein ParE